MKAIPIILASAAPILGLTVALGVGLGAATPAAANGYEHQSRWRPQHHWNLHGHHHWRHQGRHQGHHWRPTYGYNFGYSPPPRVYYAPAPVYYGNNW